MKLYTTKQAAPKLGYKNAATVKALINRKKIKAKKLGRDWIIDLAEIDRVIEERE